MLSAVLANERGFHINRMDFPARDVVDRLALEMAAMFEDDNRNFSRVTWLAACRNTAPKAE